MANQLYGIINGQGEFKTKEGILKIQPLRTVRLSTIWKKPVWQKATVNTADDLKAVIANPEIKTINIEEDLSGLTECLNVAGEGVTINGNGKTVSFTGLVDKDNSKNDGLVISGKGVTVNNLIVDAGLEDAADWKGVYAVQVYNAPGVTLNNVTATGANGGILVNSAAVTLKGNIDVSNNGFGGIEVSKNSSATENGNLTIADGATVVNTSEAYGLPTVWVVDGQGEFTTTGGFTENTTIKEDQTQYYLKEDSLKKATVNTVEDLQAAVANPEVKIINIEKELPAL